MWLAVAPVVVLITGLVAPHAEARGGWTRTVRRDYVGSDLAPWPGAAVCSHDDDGPGIGCVSLGRTMGDIVRVTIDDRSGLPVGGLVQIRDGERLLSSRAFCGTSGPLPPVRGTLTVYLRAQAGYSLTCAANGSVVATKGRVEATFTAHP